MCFHTKQSKDAQTLEHKFKAKIKDIDLFQTSNHFNGFAFPKTPAITNEDSNLIEMISWGLIPKWANPDWNRTYTLNARIETLNEKVAFRDCVENRCVILVDGFYEWQNTNNSKQKYLLHFNDNPFGLAGLYSVKNQIKTYTIITTEAKGIMRKVHNTKLRMPIAIKDTNKMHDWLNGKEIQPVFNFNTTPKLIEQTTLF